MQGKKYTDMSISLLIFLLKYVGLWVAKGRVEQCQRKLATIYTISIMWFCLFLEIRDLYLSWGNLNAVLYVNCNLLTIALIGLKVHVIFAHKTDFIDLILCVQEHFLNRSYDNREKAILAEGKKVCTYFTISVTVIGECAAVAYIVTPIAASIGKNESDRLLPFNMWLSPKYLMTPWYEMLFSFQTMNLFQMGVCYFCFDNFFCILSVHIATQFRILQYRLEKLCEINQGINEENEKSILMCYDNFKCSVQQHQKLIDCCDTLEKVYTLIIFGQVLLSSVLICLFGYQILLANSSFARRCIFVFLLACSISLLYMFTYSCDGLMERSDQIGTAMYSATWTVMPMNKFGKMLRNDLMIVILRSRRVCCMTANGFFPVSLETFTTILSTAASYFTLLRNSI